MKKEQIRFEMKTMSPDDMDLMIEWAVEEGWNPGIYDKDCLYMVDPNGFFLGEYMGRPIGCIASVRYSETYGFIGYYFVEEDYRKQWIGTYLARIALNHMEKRNIGIDVLQDRIDTFKRLGFKTAYKIVRYECNGNGNITSGISDVKDIPLTELVRYDAKMFSAPRESFIKAWINQPDSSGFCIIKNGKMKGYGVIRKSTEGFRIGPLFADNEEVAETIFVALLSCAPNEQVYIDIPQINSEAKSLAKRHHMKPDLEIMRMYSKKEPGFPVKNVYGFTTFELG